MKLIIDAEVVLGVYKEDVLGQDHDLTDSVSAILQGLQTDDSLYLDEGNHIEQEWRNLVDQDWFEAWLSHLLQNGRVFRIAVKNWNELLKHLERDFGFPLKNSRDKWYIRTGKAIGVPGEPAILVTEDVHFHEPRCGRASARRARIMRAEEGALAAYLRRREDIEVRSVCQHTARCA